MINPGASKVVWIFNHYAQEPGGSGGTRHFSLSKYLKNIGWDMKIIAASVDHFVGSQRLGGKENYRCDEVDGVSFVWLKTPVYHGNGFSRVFNMLAYSTRAYFGHWRNVVAKPDVIIGSSVHPFAAVVAACLAKKYSVPFVFEVRDLWPETLVAIGKWSDGSWKTKLFRLMETWLYKKADKIITLLPYAGEYINSLGIEKDKVVWISNGVELNGAPLPLNDHKNGGFTLMYFGAHGLANGLDNLLSAMRVLQEKYHEKKIRLRMIGEGPHKSFLIEKAKSLGLSNVDFECPVIKSKIPALASQADAFVLCVRDLPGLYRYGISMNKIYDYMAAGRPIIMASNARNNPVLNGKCGVTVSADDSFKLADAIHEMAIISAEERSIMGANGRSYVEKNFDYRVLARAFAKVLNTVSEK